MLTPFDWGTSDCAMFADVVKALTGFDPIEGIRGYASELSAVRRLRAAGYVTTYELVAAHFPEIDPALAGRGDLGYPAEIPHPLMSPAVIDGAYAYSKGLDGAVIMPRSLITRAFAV